MSTNWILELIQAALSVWSEKLSEIYTLLTVTPENFRGGSIWSVISGIHDGLHALAYALLVLFFLTGVMRSASSLTEIKRPEHALRLFLRFVIAKAAVTYSMDLLTAIYKILQGVVTQISGSSGGLTAQPLTVPDELAQKVLEVGFLDSIPLTLVTVLCVAVIYVLSFLMILTVYSRFFTLYMYTALAPVPLSSFAAEGSSGIGKQFLKSFAGVCLQGAVILLACVIFSAFAASPPELPSGDASAALMVWQYLGELIFNLLVLVGTVRLADRIVRDMVGF